MLTAGGQGRVAVDDEVHYRFTALYVKNVRSQGKGADIGEDNVFQLVVSVLYACKNACSLSNGSIRVDICTGALACYPFDECPDCGHFA